MVFSVFQFFFTLTSKEGLGERPSMLALLVECTFIINISVWMGMPHLNIGLTLLFLLVEIVLLIPNKNRKSFGGIIQNEGRP
jgi:hypothetical protein